MTSSLARLMLIALILLAAVPNAEAAPQRLAVLSHRFYPAQDIVFVDIENPTFTPVDRVSVNMVIRESSGLERVLAIGQSYLPPDLILAPGEHASTRVPIRARALRELPASVKFEFRISGRPRELSAVPPDVILQESANGITLDHHRDDDGVPMVFGFAVINPAQPVETTVRVSGAVLTFYNRDHKIVWSEILPVDGKIVYDQSLMVWGRFEHITEKLVTDIATVEVKFVVFPAK